MRRAALILVGNVVVVSGCFAPFSWPDNRVTNYENRSESANSPASHPQSAIRNPNSEDHLAVAADRIEKGDDTGALPHLAAHVAANPDAVMIRAYLAELLLRVGRTAEARPQFERVIADAQRTTGPARGHLVHCHTRLMEIAGAGNDEYAEQLHRGIGLLVLVRKWDADAERRDDAEAERTLAKATRALRSAIQERPFDARAHLYLGEAYQRLGQPSAAQAAWHAAQAGLPDPSLTISERDALANHYETDAHSGFRK